MRFNAKRRGAGRPRLYEGSVQPLMKTTVYVDRRDLDKLRSMLIPHGVSVSEWLRVQMRTFVSDAIK